MKSSFFVPFIFVFILFSFQINSQSFQISHVPAEYFSLDKFNNEVYYANFFTWELYVKNSYTIPMTKKKSLIAFRKSLNPFELQSIIHDKIIEILNLLN